MRILLWRRKTPRRSISAATKKLFGESLDILKIKIQNDATVFVGRYGALKLKKGIYFYIGSGRSNYHKRIARHLRYDKKTHWHIDFILASPQAHIQNVLVHDMNEECLVAQELLQTFTMQVIKKGLGSSDCTCPSHFYRLTSAHTEVAAFLKRKGYRIWNPH